MAWGGRTRLYTPHIQRGTWGGAEQMAHGGEGGGQNTHEAAVQRPSDMRQRAATAATPAPGPSRCVLRMAKAVAALEWHQVELAVPELVGPEAADDIAVPAALLR
jgi:hypothetical protein